jgi:hypothetical protein
MRVMKSPRLFLLMMLVVMAGILIGLGYLAHTLADLLLWLLFAGRF